MCYTDKLSKEVWTVLVTYVVSRVCVVLAYTIVALVIKHKGSKFTAPAFEVLSSLYVKGTIRWGDGQSEDYTSSASHSYADNKEHSISFDLTGVGAVEFSDVVGVTEIDFTNF